MGRGDIPDRWIPYKPRGEVIEGTRFICFKVPLRLNVQKDLQTKWDIETLLESTPNLGLVVDLTFTSRYYNPCDITSKGVQYQKIFCPGRELPEKRIVDSFFKVIDDYLQADNEKLIGIHCTHGLNRTGYFVCRYMRDKMGISADTAIKAFEVARGYKIERENFLADLRGEAPPPSDFGKHTKIIPLEQQATSNKANYAKEDINNKQYVKQSITQDGNIPTERNYRRYDNRVNNKIHAGNCDSYNNGYYVSANYGRNVHSTSNISPRNSTNYGEQIRYNRNNRSNLQQLNKSIYEDEHQHTNNFVSTGNDMGNYPSNERKMAYSGRNKRDQMTYNWRKCDSGPSTSNNRDNRYVNRFDALSSNINDNSNHNEPVNFQGRGHSDFVYNNRTNSTRIGDDQFVPKNHRNRTNMSTK